MLFITKLGAVNQNNPKQLVENLSAQTNNRWRIQAELRQKKSLIGSNVNYFQLKTIVIEMYFLLRECLFFKASLRNKLS